MRLFEIKPLFEEVFKPDNFPLKGNEGFSATVGKRTNYINNPDHDSQNRTIGFSLVKTVPVILPRTSITSLEHDTRVYITNTGLLVRGNDLGLPGAGAHNKIFTLVGLKSAHPNHSIGYIMVSSIEKPGGIKQARVSKGSIAQEKVAEKLKEMNPKIEIIAIARPGSTKIDVHFRLDGTPYKVEVKNKNTRTGPITFYDKTARKQKIQKSNAAVLDDFANAFFPGKTFTQVVERARKKDPTIGFAGDEGVAKTGSLKQLFTTTDPTILSRIKDVLIDHFRAADESFFAVYHAYKDQANIYFTSIGRNILNVPNLPNLTKFTLASYGTTPDETIRAGLKITIKEPV